MTIDPAWNFYHQAQAYITEMITSTRLQILNSRKFLDPECTDDIPQTACVRPALHHVAKQQRIFKLFSTPSFLMKYITITEPNLRYTFGLAGTRRISGNAFDFALDLSKVRAGRGSTFANIITTDGYNCSVHFFRPRRPDTVLPDLDPNDFAQWELDFVRLWGIDPGLSEIFVASDRSTTHDDRPIENSLHEIRQFSTVECYTKAGYKSFTKILQERKIAAHITEIESHLHIQSHQYTTTNHIHRINPCKPTSLDRILQHRV
ncbi:uncharacterized protein BYT42DRAFT_99492 [Radiomyces spectabilis]|uniref:uncharacterized protein n=1 Tax=Radiomyces spectabilis TaxID=64574 RepID=UPI00222115A4|nr:uncharacterized protein BYT42DRAFT_99492 [Radiomyces spectabilis]KAI8370700.1 hypothetical protein BYT42DRAFT_99492 [Radiomyces spectabilis]